MDAIYLGRSKEFDEVSHEVSHIKLVQIAWKKNTVKLRIGNGLRGRNKQLLYEMYGVHKYLGLGKLVEDGIIIIFSSVVRKRMELIFIICQDFKEYDISPQISLRVFPY